MQMKREGAKSPEAKLNVCGRSDMVKRLALGLGLVCAGVGVFIFFDRLLVQALKNGLTGHGIWGAGFLIAAILIGLGVLALVNRFPTIPEDWPQ